MAICWDATSSSGSMYMHVHLTLQCIFDQIRRLMTDAFPQQHRQAGLASGTQSISQVVP